MRQVVENDESELDGEFDKLFKELKDMNEAENDFTADEYILIMKFQVFTLLSIQRW